MNGNGKKSRRYDADLSSMGQTASRHNRQAMSGREQNLKSTTSSSLAGNLEAMGMKACPTCGNITSAPRKGGTTVSAALSDGKDN